MEDFKIPIAIAPPPVTSAKSESNLVPIVSAPDKKAPQPKDGASKPVAPNEAKCPYIEPKWSSPPNSDYHYKFEILKSGSIVEQVDNLQSQPYWVFGRLPVNDIVMAHPTISRFHAVLQYRPTSDPVENTENKTKSDGKFGEGWYLYDLGSTHGTFVNKMQIPPKTYIPVKVGHIVTLGGSTRKYILQGPEFDEEPESELTVTELKERRALEEEQRRVYQEQQEELRQKEGINWGMGEDADEETDLSVNPYASTNNEELYLNDPKKTLRGFFEREGLDLEYKADEMSLGTFICRIELPIDDDEGKPIIAEVCHKGKKKECVFQCALEACRILDRHGVLRQANHEPMKRRAPKSDSDDDDDFWDRTGDVERKKLRKANTGHSTTLTYEDLLKQKTELTEKISNIKEKILRYQEETKRSKEQESAGNDDDLDDFMNHLSYEKKIDKTEVRKLRMEEQRLQVENEKLQRLIKIAKPIDLPSIKQSDDNTKKKTFLPLFGKRNTSRFQFTSKLATTTKPEVNKEYRSDEEEIEDDETNVKPKEKLKISRETVKEIDEERMKIDASETERESHNETEINAIPSTDKDINMESPTNEAVKSVKGPAFIPPEFLITDKPSPCLPAQAKTTKIEKQAQEDSVQDNQATDEIDDDDDDDDNNKDDTEIADESSSLTNKKRRNRNRIRTKGRENVDFDDKEELVDGEKYSGWVPPQNQTGDGITSLNKKFGY